MSGPSEWEVTASQEAIYLLIRALARNLKKEGYSRQRVGPVGGGPEVSQYFRAHEEHVIAVAAHRVTEGYRLRVESETLDIAPVVAPAIARAAADLIQELLSGQSPKLKLVTQPEINEALLRLMQG